MFDSIVNIAPKIKIEKKTRFITTFSHLLIPENLKYYKTDSDRTTINHQMSKDNISNETVQIFCNTEKTLIV